jgi:ParB family chromosome partitioning protein
MQRNPLGRGLAVLLHEGGTEDAVRHVPIDSLSSNPYQPRRTFDAQQLEELAGTIKDSGILQPLIVRQVGHDRFEIIVGERRHRAARMAGLATVPVIVRQAEDQQMLMLALVENLQREDVNPADAALAYARLANEFGLKQDEIAARVGKSRGVISNAARLLTLPRSMFDSLQRGEMNEGHARALLALPEGELQRELHRQIVQEGLSVREAERRARFFRKPPDKPEPEGVAVPPADPNWQRIEEVLSETLGARVQIQRIGTGGRIVVPFFDEEDLARILECFGITH